MKKKSVIAFAILMILVTGCSQSDEKEKEIGAKAGISSIDSKDSTKDSDKKEEDSNQSDKNTKTDESENSQQDPTSEKQNANTATSKQSTSSQTNPSTANGDNKQQQSQQQQEQPKQEQTQPEPVKPKPSAPACDNTIPAGAYPIEREAEIDAQVQAEMTENQVNGDGTFTQYKTEYGYTECGKKYFYIIRIYS